MRCFLFEIHNACLALTMTHRDSLNKTTQLDISTKMLGLPCSLPIFIAPAALARLGHSDGEMNLARAAWKEDVIMCVRLHKLKLLLRYVEYSISCLSTLAVR